MVSGRNPDWKLRRKVVELRGRGLTVKEIGRRLGFTHQNVCRLLKGINRDGFPDVFCRACGEWVASGALATRGEQETLCLVCLEQTPLATIGQRLKSLRLAAGLTVVGLASRARIPVVSVRAYEANRNHPGTVARARLARALRVSAVALGPDYLAPGWRGRGRPKRER